MLERFFQLNAHGTTVRKELVAGLTTFAVMSAHASIVLREIVRQIK